MFLDFYGLREQPFGMTPDPAYLYASRTHGDALAALSQGIAENRGFFALIAQPGMGKTTLLYQLLEDLRESSRTVIVSQTECTSREFIEYILQELGVDRTGMGFVAMHGKLNEILFGELLAGKRFVLVVDEAQNLDDTVLETVRMLSNFETHNAKLLQIVLAGQPRLAAKLAQPRLSQLRQRVAVLSHLEPFSAEETRLYIEHRLKVAGYCGEPIFDAAAIGAIARQSGGIPRNINNLCYNSMQMASTRGLRVVTAEIVQEAMTRLDFESLVSADSVGAAKPVAIPVPATKPAKIPALPPAPAAPPVKTVRQPNAFLSYNAPKKISQARWPVRSAILAALVLSGILALAILGRSESRHGIAPGIFDHSSDALGGLARLDQSNGQSSGYDAAPQDTGNGQVLTVVAGPRQSIKDLCLRYVGRFDDALSGQILSLNPGLKDPDHLEAGQLIRIPLPSGALKKVNDTQDADSPAKSGNSGSLFGRFTALLRERK
jgi:type II secretory pathway predicted ATPase ExeA